MSAHPGPLPAGWRLEVVESVASTSRAIAERAAAGEREGLAILAREQTEGRGRAGRSWSSGRGDLMVSLLLRPQEPARLAREWPILAGVAVLDALRPATPAPELLRLKWPNDVMLGEAKMGGVLIESVVEDERIKTLVIGVGINLRGAPLVDQPTACLADVLAGGAPPDPVVLAGALLRAIKARVEQRRARGFAPIADAWRAAARAQDLPALAAALA